ncbi:MAG: DNA polymerase I [Acidimicrobiia bacterium]|nr:DNA polymerase I [Acidimicrobiia bacterium]
MRKLVLLDGHSLSYRAFYALPTDLATPSGQVTNAAYGFTSMVIRLFADEKPDAAAVAWDLPGKTFRSEAYSEYKAQREAPPDIFRSQLPLIREVADALRIPQFSVPGFEADDVIATIAKRVAGDDWEVLVVTGDRDAFQLIGDGIRVMYTRRGITDTVNATPEWVNERYGITPAQYVDYAALRGDPSDNLPGVPGVGEKTASKLISGYGSIEGIYEHIEEHSPKLRQNLEASKDQVFLNRTLSVLREDTPVEATADDLVLEPWDATKVREVFDGLAFRSLWDRLVELGGSAVAEASERLDVEVATELDPRQIVELAGRDGALAPLWEGDSLAGIALATADGASFVPADALEALLPSLADASIPKVVHDAKPLARALLRQGADLRGVVFDTALAAFLINPAERAPSLADLAESVLEVAIGENAESQSAPQGTLDFEATAPDLEGAGRSAVATRLLVEPLQERMEARGGSSLYADVELPLVRVLARMEATGIEVDRPYLEELGSDLRERLGGLEKQIHDDAGEPFNVNSTLQLREVLFSKLELPVLKKTPKGVASTDASVLLKLAPEHPIVERLLEYRELEKLRSTYVDGLLPLIEPDGRVHARFNQMAAATGRLSSENPNLQNIPVRSAEGMTIRRAFVAADGATFVVADYSQIELRILAHMSGDAALVEAFEKDEDVHTATAARVFETTDVTADMRRMAKVINFGLLYGMEAYGLAQRLEIDTEEAQQHMDAYFGQFPDVQAFMDGIVEDARSSGYTTTILGRRRYLPELASGNFRQRQMGERMALNAPIQGSAADIIKKAMVELDAELEARDDGSALLLQIHDELVLEVPETAAQDVTDLVRTTMEGIVELNVPLRVSTSLGSNLAETKS